ncbi:MAG TPA: TetR/AcrR family transcriptional regulator [Solirubrobacteraceae bacterium]|nr:TetR/AcrR family transcriptional regulator [Solirubrobacteraceae bacterium]
MASIEQTSRPYRGITATERRASRQELLLRAGLELFGTAGYASSTIRAISAQASLNPRYFYESFDSREELLYQVYRDIIREITTAATEGTSQAQTIEEKARAGLRAGWTILTDDRRKARVLALEVVGVSDRLERVRRKTRHKFADLLFAELLKQSSRSLADRGIRVRLDPGLTARSLMGGVVEVLADWINGEVDASPDEIIEHFTLLFTAAAHAAVATAADGAP